jgi:hypothetical protein
MPVETHRIAIAQNAANRLQLCANSDHVYTGELVFGGPPP